MAVAGHVIFRNLKPHKKHVSRLLLVRYKPPTNQEYMATNHCGRKGVTCLIPCRQSQAIAQFSEISFSFLFFF
jgi:hypothetical protein